MTPYPSSLGATVAVNIKLLLATFLGWVSWNLWPSSIDWWGFWLLAAISALGAVAAFIDAIKLMTKLYQRNSMIAAYMAQGRAPKSSEMASVDQLEKAGMR